MMKIRSLHLGRVAACLALLTAAIPPLATPALAENKATPAFEAFVKTFSAVEDYQDQIVVHETTDDAKQTQDRTYAYKWKKPTLATILVLDGPGKGSGGAWRGGDKVRGHQGGILSGIHMIVDIHDPRGLSLRGDTIEVASFNYELKHYLATPGTLTEAPGPAIDGDATTAVTLSVTDAKTNGNVSKDVLYLSNARHLPVRREQFVGNELVKTENFKNVKLNNGFKLEDFS